MASIDFFKQSNQSVNQGDAGIELTLGRFHSLIVGFKGHYFTEAQAADLLVTLRAAALANNPAERLYIIPNIGEDENRTSDDRMRSLAYGSEKTLGHGKRQYTFVPQSTSLDMLDRLQRFNGRGEDIIVYIVDDEYNIIGTRGTDASGNKVIKGFTLEDYWAKAVEIGLEPKHQVKLSFANAKEFTDGNMAVMQNVGFNPAVEVTWMSDSTIIQAAPIAAGVVEVYVKSGRTNLLDTMHDAFAQAAAWSGAKSSNGNAVTLTSVAKSTVNGEKTIKLTFDTTDPDYPTTGTNLSIIPATPSALAALTIPIKGFEGQTIFVKIP